MRLRLATLDDLPLILRWNEAPHVPDFGWDWAAEISRKLDWRELLIAELDGRAIGFMQILDPAREESHYWGDCEEHTRALDIWLGEPRDFGQGHGTQMMHLAIDRCFADSSVEAVFVDPEVDNTRSHQFYERLGFRRVDTRTFSEGDVCHVYRLDRAQWLRPQR